VATVLGTLVAMVLVPLRSLGPDGWKIASALLSRHIGGGQFSLFSFFIFGNFCGGFGFFSWKIVKFVHDGQGLVWS
jgi:hypothetical protein